MREQPCAVLAEAHAVRGTVATVQCFQWRALSELGPTGNWEMGEWGEPCKASEGSTCGRDSQGGGMADGPE
jgi:hypothetical protein